MTLPRLQVSDNQRFLVTVEGDPFFWLGDTAWELFHRCDRDEIEHYLENRRQKGFNVIQAVGLAELDGLHTPNPYGDVPLVDDDPTQPVEAYWQHVDFAIRLAAEKGIYMALLPTWGDKVKLQWGVGPIIFNADNARVFGQWIGARYKDDSNVVWVLGGDRFPDGDEDIWRAMAEGILAGAGDDALISYHPQGVGSSGTILHHEDWLSFNMIQSSHSQRDTPNWEMITADYHRQPTKPIMEAEPCYEDIPIQFKPELGYFTDYDVRKAAYRGVFAGGFGHTYGHASIWQMKCDGEDGVLQATTSWKDSLDRPGAAQMVYLRKLMESRPFLSRVPDQDLIVGDPGTGPSHARATRGDGYAMVYFPTAGQTVTVNVGRIGAEKVWIWWYDPRNGSATPREVVPASGVRDFTSPAVESDWVLVLDDPSREFNPPGKE